MPMMPMLPAKAVIKVRPFLVIRLLNDSASAVKNDIEVCRTLPSSTRSSASGSKGLVSSITWPSLRCTTRVAYCSANSGLWVTMTTSRSAAISVSSAMICRLVVESSAPVGSSASRISGSFTSARAIATRCIWPPESWLGRLWMWSRSPTSSSASMARARRSLRLTPARVRANSTLASTVWCGIRL